MRTVYIAAVPNALRSGLSLIVALATLVGLAAGPLSPSIRLHAAAAAAQEIDSDGDTMPDVWEEFFGLNPDDPTDAAGNLDGDDLTNAQEYAARRHPNGRHVRYFAEGSTGFFDTSLGLLNPSPTETAHVAIALLVESGGIVSHRLTLDPLQRQTISINDVLGASAAVSLIVESDTPVAADRWMTWGTTGIGASLDSGAPAPATTWYFAEGATGPFLLYYLFENPGAAPANVTVRYLIEGAPAVEKTHLLAPQSRTTVFVNADDPALVAASVGAVVTSDVPIFAERAMYVNAGGTLGGGSASSASNQAATQWYFGEGSTGPFFHAFLALMNPGTTPAIGDGHVSHERRLGGRQDLRRAGGGSHDRVLQRRSRVGPGARRAGDGTGLVPGELDTADRRRARDVVGRRLALVRRTRGARQHDQRRGVGRARRTPRRSGLRPDLRPRRQHHDDAEPGAAHADPGHRRRGHTYCTRSAPASGSR